MVRRDVLREVNRPATNSEMVRKTRSQTQNLNLKKKKEIKSVRFRLKQKKIREIAREKNITKATEVCSVRTTRSILKVFEEKNAAKTDDIQSNSVRITRSKSNIASVKKIESISYNLPHAKSNEKNIVVKRVDFIKLNVFKEKSVVLAKQKYLRFSKISRGLEIRTKIETKKCDRYLAGIHEIKTLLGISYEESLLNAI